MNIGELTDRLYAPLNKRFTKKEMEKYLYNIKFKKIEVRDVRDGLFCKLIIFLLGISLLPPLAKIIDTIFMNN